MPEFDPYTPFETESRIEKIGSGLLGGLGYLGDLLDKTFGGRAIRGGLGMLTGDSPVPASELLSFLPLSDTLGVTDIKNKVSGRQLLENAGVINPADEEGFSGDDLLGIAAEIGLDPSTYFGAAVPRLLARGARSGVKATSAGLEGLTGINPYTYAGRQIEKAKVPIRTLFDPDVAGATLKPSQTVAADVYTPELEKGRQLARQAHIDALTPMDDLIKAGGNPEVLRRAEMYAGEGHLDEAYNTAIQGGYSPADAAFIRDSAFREARRVESGTLASGRAEGALSKVLGDTPDWILQAQEATRNRNLGIIGGSVLGPIEDIPFQDFKPSQYIHRTAIDEASFQGLDAGRAIKNDLAAVSGAQVSREDAFRGFPGGTIGINDMIRNPAMNPRTVPELAIKNEVSKMLTGHSAGAPPAAWANTSWGTQAWEGAQKQVDDIYNKLKNYEDPVREKGLYIEDLLGGNKAREMDQARVDASAKTVLAGLDPKLGQIQKIDNLRKAGTPFVRVTDFLESAALIHTDALGVPVAQGKVADMLGINKNNITQMGKDLYEYGIPLDVAQDMKRIGQAWKTPEALKPLLGLADGVMQNLRANFTYPFPAFHIRNLFSGLFNQWRGNALAKRSLGTMQELQRGGTVGDEVATKLYPGLSASDASKQLRNDMIADEVAFVRSGQFGEKVGPQSAATRTFMAGQLPDAGGKAASFYDTLKGGIREIEGTSKAAWNPLNSEKFALAQAGREIGNYTEDLLRGSHYLEKRLQGMSRAEAKMETLKYQVDYAAMTQFEKNVMKRIFPFYAYSRRSLPPMLEDLAKNPAKLASGIRVATGGAGNDEFVPEWVGESTAIPLGKNPDGTNRYLKSLGLPFEDEGFRAVGSLFKGDGARALQGVLGQASPVLKLPIEQGSNVQLSTGRKLTDLRANAAVAGLGEGLESVGIDQPGNQTQQLLSELLSATPFSRFATSVGKFTDPRKGTGATLLNTLTGVNVTDVDANKTQLIAARDQLADVMRSSKNIRNFEEFYVPKEKLGTLSPEELDAYMLFRGIEAKAKADAKKRKANQGLSAGLLFE